MVAFVDGILSILLRIGELAFAAVVAGLTGSYLHSIQNVSAFNKWRFIFTEVIAALSMLLALLWLLPFTATYIHWPIDFLLFALWMIAFGLLVQFIGPLDCGSVFYWGDITQQGTCQRWKADVAFAFLSAIFWLASALLGLWFLHRHRKGYTGRHAVAGDGVGTNTVAARRRWYRRY
jgi:hypothetical protein